MTLATASPNRSRLSHPICVTRRDHDRLTTIVRDALITGSERRLYLVALLEELARATVVPSEDVPPDTVTMNSIVRVRDLDTGEVDAYHLVYPSFADAMNDRVSILAPIGTALLGCSAGDVVEWPVPSGTVRLRIEAVEFQPEREGRYDV